MINSRLGSKITVSVITLCLTIGLLCISDSFASQPCFKYCGSGIWHVDNKMPCSGKSCNYCIKCNGCGGSGQIPDSAKRCEVCKGLGQVHKNSKKVVSMQGAVIVLRANPAKQRVG
jgi:DnaJ-class molecular chaperone